MFTSLKCTNTTTILATDKSTDYELMLHQQSLRDTMRNINAYNSGNNVNGLITDMIPVKPELPTPIWEKNSSKLLNNYSTNANSRFLS